MASLREWIRRFWGTLRANRDDRDLEEELRLHLELAAEDALRRGHTTEPAPRAARIHAGGANTAIFTIVNGVILRPLWYPKPEQVMYLSTYNSFFSSEFPVAPAEYFEFRAINRSFSDVGAFTTGEVNLTASDRPLRVRSAL